MLKSYRYLTVGIHLLLMVHVGRTFVLLTANIEDVKKLARKFVSDSLADKIAEFLVKATRKAMNSEENKLRDSSFSEENIKFAAGRQDTSSESLEGTPKYEAKKFQPYYPKERSKKYGYNKEKQKRDRRTDKYDHKAHSDEHSIVSQSQYAYNIASQKKLRDNLKPDKEYGTKERSKYITNEIFNKNKPKPIENVISFRGSKIEPEEFDSHGETKPKSFEENEIQKPEEEVNSPGDVNIDIVTTPRTDDEWDDSTSPRFVATSGGVALPKMPDDDNDGTNQRWNDSQ